MSAKVIAAVRAREEAKRPKPVVVNVTLRTKVKVSRKREPDLLEVERELLVDEPENTDGDSEDDA